MLSLPNYFYPKATIFSQNGTPQWQNPTAPQKRPPFRSLLGAMSKVEQQSRAKHWNQALRRERAIAPLIWRARMSAPRFLAT
jgi:hypothetical protein